MGISIYACRVTESRVAAIIGSGLDSEHGTAGIELRLPKAGRTGSIDRTFLLPGVMLKQMPHSGNL